MAASNGKQIFTMHILLNISRTKGNQTMKFGWQNLIWKVIFLKNHTHSVMEKTDHRLFSKKAKLSVSLDLQSEILFV